MCVVNLPAHLTTLARSIFPNSACDSSREHVSCENTYLELHSGELMQGFSALVLDHGPRYLVVRLRCVLHRALGQVVEGDDVLEHADGLVEWAVAIIWGVGVLLEEVVLEQFGDL